ncbi:MAG: TrmH family RNA methyltransferase, partial [Pyrinomonadaceae bacterium]
MKTTHKRQRPPGRLAHQEDAQRHSSRLDIDPRSALDAGSDKRDDQIYGLIPVLEALRAGQRAIDSITIAEGARHERLRDLLQLASQANVPVHRVPRINLDRSLRETTHQGVVARTAAARYKDADELLEQIAARVGTEQPPLVLGLDGIEDPRNFGAILRTAECAGVHGVFIPERRAVGRT